MMVSDAVRTLEELARELDLVVYRLEGPLEDRDPLRERALLRRDLDRLRERLEDVAQDLSRH